MMEGTSIQTTLEKIEEELVILESIYSEDNVVEERAGPSPT